MSIPASYALDLYRGDSYALGVRIWSDDAHTIPADLTGATAAAQIRTESGVLILAFVCAIISNSVNLSLTPSSWPASTTDRARWDLQLTYPSGSVRTVVAGPVRILADVTVPV